MSLTQPLVVLYDELNESGEGAISMSKALLVNDSRFESLILRDLLQQLDYDVELADEFDALNKLETTKPDLVVVNYIMEETRGDELVQVMKDVHPELTCLISSSSKLDRQAFKEIGVDGILRTPVSMFTLKDILKRAIESEEKLVAVKVEVPEQDAERICYHCNADISMFSEAIVFCPFCGESLDE